MNIVTKKNMTLLAILTAVAIYGFLSCLQDLKAEMVFHAQELKKERALHAETKATNALQSDMIELNDLIIKRDNLILEHMTQGQWDRSKRILPEFLEEWYHITLLNHYKSGAPRR